MALPRTRFVRCSAEKATSGISIPEHRTTPFGDILQNIKPSKAFPITSANNAKMAVKQVGDTMLKINNEEIEIKDVLHIPDLACNLLSVNKIVEKGNEVKFNKEGCTISNPHDQVLFTCKPENGVYTIKEGDCLSLFTNGEIDAVTWHRRLGHLSYGRVAKEESRCSVFWCRK